MKITEKTTVQACKQMLSMLHANEFFSVTDAWQEVMTGRSAAEQLAIAMNIGLVIQAAGETPRSRTLFDAIEKLGAE